MKDPDSARRIAYIVLALGVVLAFAGSLVPHYDAGYRLSVALLIFQLLPYVIYSGLIIQKNGFAIAIPGILIILVDIYAQLQAWFYGLPEGSPLFDYLPLWLTIVVLPAGWALGAILGKGTQDEETSREAPEENGSGNAERQS